MSRNLAIPLADMKIKLLKESRIRHKAGEIVEVSPAEANFLLGVGAAVMAENKAEEKKPKTVKKKAAK